MSTATLTKKQEMRLKRVMISAEELMLEQGFYKLSITQLCNRLKVSRSTIYEHFGSKEGLVEAVVKAYREKLDRGIHQIFTEPALSPTDKLSAMAMQMVENLHGRDTSRFLEDLKLHMPLLYNEYLQDRDKRTVRYYAPLIKEAIAIGSLPSHIPEDFLLHLYLNTVRMACQSDLIEKSGLTKAQVIKNTIRVFFDGASKL